MLLAILSWIVFGAIVGWIASILSSQERRRGVVVSVLVGIVGALFGGFAIHFFIGGGFTDATISSIIVAITFSVVLLVLLRGFHRKV